MVSSPKGCQMHVCSASEKSPSASLPCGHRAAPGCSANGACALLHIPPWRPHILSPRRFRRCYGAGAPQTTEPRHLFQVCLLSLHEI
jgi:hypothetical protein